MGTFVSGKSDFVQAPEGVHNAVCVDVVDLGMVSTSFGPKHQIRIVWELETLMPPDKRNPQVQRPFMASKWYTASIGSKANLRKDLQSWRGKPFTEEELDKFDVDNVLQKPCRLVIQEYDKQDGSKGTKVISIMKADPKVIIKPSGFYERVKDRNPQQGAPASHAGATPGDVAPPEDDNIPF
jgi:hypothetical protein